MINEVINLMAECLEKEPKDIKSTDEFREYEEWDSLAYLSVIAKIDEDYHLVIPRDEFQKIRTIKDLTNYLENK